MLSWLMLCRASTHHETRRTATSHSKFDAQAAILPNSLVNLYMAVGILIIVFAIVACLSRGGLLAMGSAAFVCAIIFARLRLIDTNLTLFLGSLVLLVIVGALSLSGD